MQRHKQPSQQQLQKHFAEKKYAALPDSISNTHHVTKLEEYLS